MSPSYTIEDIKTSIDAGLFARAVDLYTPEIVTQFKQRCDGFSAVVIGSSPYDVFVSGSHYDIGRCSCYVANKNKLCKHRIVVALWAAKAGASLTHEDKHRDRQTFFSGRCGELTPIAFAKIKKAIVSAQRFITANNNP